MAANKKYVNNLIYKGLVYKVRGYFYNVYSKLNPGFKEPVYRKALAVKFDIQGISYEEEKRIVIEYKDKNAGYYTPDFTINKKIIGEIKAINNMLKLCEIQFYYYLKGIGYKLRHIVNFGAEKIDIGRRIYDKVRKLASNELTGSSVQISGN